MEKYTVLTYIIGNYEIVHELEFDPTTTPHVEYILVTDNKELTSKTWKVIYDESLNNPSLLPFDRVFSIRYNLFKYASNDICIRIDGSVGIVRPLDELVKTFIDGNYDGCVNLHVECDNLIDEYWRWITVRNFSPLEAFFHLKYMKDTFGYDFNKKGLIQLNFGINRRGALTDNIDNLMKQILVNSHVFNFTKENKDKGKHYTRLDQTLFTALITTYFSDKKWLFINDDIFKGKYMKWYNHNSNVFKNRDKKMFIDQYFNGDKKEVYYLE